MIITDEHIRDAGITLDAAPDIILATETALHARGVTDPYETIAALLGAAWYQHKEMHGGRGHDSFATLLRGMADSVDRAACPH